MSLDDQKAKSGRYLEAPDAASTPPGARENGKIHFEFKARDFVVYPAHGVGQIVSIEEQTVAGASLEFFVIFFTKSRMTVRVPVRKAANVGMRKPSDLSSVQGVKQILSETPRKGRGNWSRLAQEYEGKIKSGDIVAVAEVARDLFRPGELRPEFQRTAVVRVGARSPLRRNRAGRRNLRGTGPQGTRGPVEDRQAQA